MNKAFVREDSDDDEPELPEPAGPPPRNYITPAGHTRRRRWMGHLGA